MLQEKEWLAELKRLRAAGQHDEAEQVRRDFILKEADRAEEMGQIWTAGMLRRRADREDIVFRKECRTCRLFFAPAYRNDVYCSASCRKEDKIRTSGVRLTLACPAYVS